MGGKELLDGDNDESRAAQQLLDALEEAEGRIQIDELDLGVMVKLQQLGEAAYTEEEFLVTVGNNGQMYLTQTSIAGGQLPPDTATRWVLHTHYGVVQTALMISYWLHFERRRVSTIYQ
jgi:hypothetical protein